MNESSEQHSCVLSAFMFWLGLSAYNCETFFPCDRSENDMYLENMLICLLHLDCLAELTWVYQSSSSDFAKAKLSDKSLVCWHFAKIAIPWMAVYWRHG